MKRDQWTSQVHECSCASAGSCKLFALADAEARREECSRVDDISEGVELF